MTQPRICLEYHAEIPVDAPLGVCPTARCGRGFAEPAMAVVEVGSRRPSSWAEPGVSPQPVGQAAWDRLQGLPSVPPSAGRRQGAARALARRSRVLRALRPRGADDGAAEPSAHRARLRLRRPFTAGTSPGACPRHHRRHAEMNCSRQERLERCTHHVALSTVLRSAPAVGWIEAGLHQAAELLGHRVFKGRTSTRPNDLLVSARSRAASR